MRSVNCAQTSSVHNLMVRSVQCQQLGVIRLCLTTSSDAGALIYSEGWMKAGRSGMFGGAIYFVDSKAAAQHKTQSGCDVFITADVDMGRALVLESAANDITLPTVRSHGCDTIKARSHQNAAWEYDVFEALRIKLISVEGKIPFIRSAPAVKAGLYVHTERFPVHHSAMVPLSDVRTCRTVRLLPRVLRVVSPRTRRILRALPK
jgi:hypothetical protein